MPEGFTALGFFLPAWFAGKRAGLPLRRNARGFFRFELLILVEPNFEQAAARQRGPHGATRLVRVSAIGETTAQRQRLDLGKRIFDSLLYSPKLQLPHSRRVDHERTRRREHKFATRGR